MCVNKSYYFSSVIKNKTMKYSRQKEALLENRYEKLLNKMMDKELFQEATELSLIFWGYASLKFSKGMEGAMEIYKTSLNPAEFFTIKPPSIQRAIEHVKNLDLIQFVPYEHHSGEPYYSATFEYQKEIQGNWLTINYYALYTQYDFETGDYKLIDFQIQDANLMHKQEVLIDKKGLMPYINIPTIE